MGDLGGVKEVIMMFFGFWLYPMSEHSFNLKAIKKIYYGKSQNVKLFKNRRGDRAVDPRANEKNIRNIYLSPSESIKVFMADF